MKRRLLCFMLLIPLLALPARAKTIQWVDFNVPYESMDHALRRDIAAFEEERHISWIDILALAACRDGGQCTLPHVKQAAKDLSGDRPPRELAGENSRYFDYYHRAYTAALGGLVGSFSIEINGESRPAYGLKAYCPIAEGFHYTHADDFGAGRTFGFKRKHLGNDLMGSPGTPIVAVEGGFVEALGWNRYGGWRVGIRSFDGKRYYYYAHLQKDAPFARDLAEGDMVRPGDVIGFMGRTGYSDEENTSNIEVVHLHFGLQLVFDESQKECNSEIWIDVYDIVKLLNRHRVTVKREDGQWVRAYPYEDLDVEEFRPGTPLSQ